MTSSRPYLIRALYDWITDNTLTPHLLVDATQESVEVPREHIHEGRIVLNVNPSAVQGLSLGNEWIEFQARFGGVARQVRLPVMAVLAVYARESGQGMAFGSEPGDTPPPGPEDPGGGGSGQKRPTLKVVK
ncbi:MAG: ClpXP protease specificity-enhancing factor [Candidatus Competibacterales bacterium]|nr:ClpXP protease specificity-enhancing factor [Candidatus Competibacterales bacterium]